MFITDIVFITDSTETTPGNTSTTTKSWFHIQLISVCNLVPMGGGGGTGPLRDGNQVGFVAWGGGGGGTGPQIILLYLVTRVGFVAWQSAPDKPLLVSQHD